MRCDHPHHDFLLEAAKDAVAAFDALAAVPPFNLDRRMEDADFGALLRLRSAISLSSSTPSEGRI